MMKFTQVLMVMSLVLVEMTMAGRRSKRRKKPVPVDQQVNRLIGRRIPKDAERANVDTKNREAQLEALNRDQFLIAKKADAKLNKIFNEAVLERFRRKLNEDYGHSGTVNGNVAEEFRKFQYTSAGRQSIICNCPIGFSVWANSGFLDAVRKKNKLSTAVICRNEKFNNKDDYAQHEKQCDNLVLYQYIDFEQELRKYEEKAKDVKDDILITKSFFGIKEYTKIVKGKVTVKNPALLKVCKKWRKENKKRLDRNRKTLKKRQTANPLKTPGYAWPNTKSESNAEALYPLFGAVSMTTESNRAWEKPLPVLQLETKKGYKGTLPEKGSPAGAVNRGRVNIVRSSPQATRTTKVRLGSRRPSRAGKRGSRSVNSTNMERRRLMERLNQKYCVAGTRYKPNRRRLPSFVNTPAAEGKKKFGESEVRIWLAEHGHQELMPLKFSRGNRRSAMIEGGKKPERGSLKYLHPNIVDEDIDYKELPREQPQRLTLGRKHSNRVPIDGLSAGRRSSRRME